VSRPRQALPPCARAHPRLEEVRHGGVDGQEQQLLDLGRQVLFREGHEAQAQVRGEVGRLEAQDALPGWVPGGAERGELRF
jgi:hypothetical protein